MEFKLEKLGAMTIIKIKTDLLKKPMTALIDTGASHSLIKNQLIKNKRNIDLDLTLNIEDCSKTMFKTVGTILTLVSFKRKMFPLYFQVVENGILPDNIDAVIGSDVLDNCSLDLANLILTMNDSNEALNNFSVRNTLLYLSGAERSDREVALINSLNLHNIDLDSRNNLINLILKYQDVFYVEGFDKLSSTNLLEHEINLNHNNPIFTKQYPIPHQFKEEMGRHVKSLVEQDIITPTMSPYNSPVILVKKKDLNGQAKFRFVID